MSIYVDPMLPTCWVVGSLKGELWIVPAMLNGWQQRRPYAIPPGALREARLQSAVGYCLMGLGVPA